MFEWDEAKNRRNYHKHGIFFKKALKAFTDPRRVIIEDVGHGGEEKRWYCLGEVEGGIMTVRFTYRSRKIRIFGAGYWRKGKKRYEKENKIYE